MYISDSLNLLTNLLLKAIAGDKVDSIDMRYADIINRKPSQPKKQETAEEVIERLTKKAKGG